MRRVTRETDVVVELNKKGAISTGDRVLDHMLSTLFFYMGIVPHVKVSYDLRHHLWEDVGITLGSELRQNLPPNYGRFGTAIVPMDDALVLVALDISGRTYLHMELQPEESESGFEVSLFREFLWGLVRGLRATLHVKQIDGVNAHHIIEAAFKALGVAISQAISEKEGTMSTKGVLE